MAGARGEEDDIMAELRRQIRCARRREEAGQPSLRMAQPQQITIRFASLNWRQRSASEILRVTKCETAYDCSSESPLHKLSIARTVSPSRPRFRSRARPRLLFSAHSGTSSASGLFLSGPGWRKVHVGSRVQKMRWPRASS